jgi:teichuronic acid biosynthesis glycosyltransferase TuaG
MPDPLEPLVSIVIPTFNRAENLKRAVASALSQTVVEIEVHVVDDGSTDHTTNVLAGFQDPRLSIHYLNKNSGSPAVPRNVGVWRSRGTWIAFLDSDDWWEPNHLATQLVAMDHSGESAACGNAFNFSVLGSEGEGVGVRSQIIETHHAAMPKEVDLALLLIGNVIITSSVVLRREDFILAEGFPSPITGQVFEDYALWLRIATFRKFVVSDEITVHYQIDTPNSFGAANVHEDAMRNTVFELQSWLRRVISTEG